MAKGQKLPTVDMDRIMERLSKLDLLDKLEDVQLTLAEIKNEMASTKKDLNMVQQMASENKKKVGELDGELRAVRKSGEERGGVMLNLQLEKMAYYLRFRNLEESDQDDLRHLMAGLLSEYTGRSPEYMGWELDQVYRVNSLYAATHGVPREVHIKLVRRETRDEILRKQRDGALIYKGKEVTILKQIPRQVRELRKKYYFLSNKLYLKGVGFRWLMPEGLMIFREGTRRRINNVTEAKAYLEEYKTLLESEDTDLGEREALGGQEVGAGAAIQDPGGGRGVKKKLDIVLRPRKK